MYDEHIKAHYWHYWWLNWRWSQFNVAYGKFGQRPMTEAEWREKYLNVWK
jgi:hypothetical protein